jgi:hypothetical protein
MFDDIGDVVAPRRDAGDRSDVIGLKRVLHTQEKSKPQYSQHLRAREVTYLTSLKASLTSDASPWRVWSCEVAVKSI